VGVVWGVVLHGGRVWPVGGVGRRFGGQRWEWSDGCVMVSFK